MILGWKTWSHKHLQMKESCISSRSSLHACPPSFIDNSKLRWQLLLPGCTERSRTSTMTSSLPLLKGLRFLLFPKKRFFLHNSFAEEPILVLKRTFVCPKNHKKRKLLAEGGEVPHLRGLIESRVLILIEIGLVFNVLGTRSKRMRGFKDLSTK